MRANDNRTGMRECLRLTGACEDTVAAVMLLLPTDREIARMARMMLSRPWIAAGELLPLARALAAEG